MQFLAIPLFDGLTQDQAEHFQSACHEIHHRAGTCLLEHGHIADRLYFVLAGEVTVKVYDDDEVPTMVSVIAPGGMAGWSALIPPHLATATLVALTDVRLVQIDGPRLRALAAERPELGIILMSNVARVISQRLAEARARLTSSLEVGSRPRRVAAPG